MLLKLNARILYSMLVACFFKLCCCWVTSVVSDSVWPHRQQPTRLPRPWDSPGKNTGVGYHFLLQCRKGKSESEVAQSCPTLCDPMDCVAHQAPPSMGFSKQEYWSGLPFPSPGESSWPRDRTHVSRIAVRSFNVWATREAPFRLSSSQMSK